MKRAKGLKVEDVRVGHGRVVVPKDIVHVHCVCRRPKGDVVFDTHDDAPFQIRVGSRESYVGLEQGVIGMKAGGVRKVKVPPQLTYYERERFPVLPKNALLFYHIELLGIRDQWDNTLHIRCSPNYSARAKGLAWLHRLLPASTGLRSPYQIVQRVLFREAEANRREAEQHTRQASSEAASSAPPDEPST